MPTDSTQTVQDILRSARSEFLAHGYENASLRVIVSGAGVTTGALYRHFADKAALFEALVAPVYNDFLHRYKAAGSASFEQLETVGLSAMWQDSPDNMEMFIHYIYDHFDTFKLLISCSEQSAYEHFTHTLIDMDVELTQKYLDRAAQLGHRVRGLSRQELHVLINAQFSCLFEMVLHDTPRAEALAMAETMTRFFIGGWRATMMEG